HTRFSRDWSSDVCSSDLRVSRSFWHGGSLVMATKNKRPALSHVDGQGRITMVDVGGKPDTQREAVAVAEIHMSPGAVRAIRTGRSEERRGGKGADRGGGA